MKQSHNSIFTQDHSYIIVTNINTTIRRNPFHCGVVSFEGSAVALCAMKETSWTSEYLFSVLNTLSRLFSAAFLDFERLLCTCIHNAYLLFLLLEFTLLLTCSVSLYWWRGLWILYLLQKYIRWFLSSYICYKNELCIKAMKEIAFGHIFCYW